VEAVVGDSVEVEDGDISCLLFVFQLDFYNKNSIVVRIFYSLLTIFLNDAVNKSIKVKYF